MAALRARLRQYFTFEEFRKGLSLRVTYVAFQLIDCLMTVLAVNAGYQELNPVMRGLLGSPTQLLTCKIIVPLAIAWLVPARLLIPALVLLVGVIGLNIKELFMLL